MDYLQFLAAVVQSLAWPVAAVACAFAFRQPLIELLGSLTTLDIKGVKADFGRRTAEANSIANELPEPETSATSTYEKVDINQWLQGSFLDLVRINPPEAVEFAWREIEQELQAASDRFHIFSPNSKHVPADLVAFKLHRAGHLPAPAYTLFQMLQGTRNGVTHNKFAVPALTVGSVIQYADSAARIIEILKSLRDVSKPPVN